MTRIVIRTEEVRHLGHQMRRKSDNLEALAHSLDGALHIPHWSGIHRGQIEGEWHEARHLLIHLAHRGEHLASLLERAATLFEETDADAVQRMAAARNVLASLPQTLWKTTQAIIATGGALLSGLVSTGRWLARSFNARLASIADPVDLRTGAYVYTHTDLILPPGEPFALQRFYTSGTGWAFSWQTRLDLSGSEEVILRLGGGHLGRVSFRRSGTGFLSDTPGFSLEQDDGGFRVLDPAGSAFRFAPDGRLVSWRDALGGEICLDYPNPRTIRFTAPWGPVWATLRLDDQGRPLAGEDDRGHPVRYTYDSLGRLIAFTDREGQTTRYEYDHRDLLTRIVGPDGTSLLENVYDEAGRVIAQKDALGQETRFAYTLSEAWPRRIQEAVVTYPDGTRARYTFSRGEVASQEVDGAEVRFTYDERGYPTEIRDPGGAIWRLAWDDAGRIGALTTPLGQTHHWEYDGAGRLLRLVAPDGAAVAIAYDHRGRPATLTGPGGESIRLEYDERGLLKAITSPRGYRLEFAYDDRERLVGLTLPGGQKITYLHDDSQGEMTVRDPLGRTTLYRYDREGRLIAARLGGSFFRFVHTPYGELERVEDEQGRAIGAEYNANGWPVRLRFPNGYTLQQAYDPLGRLVEMRDSLGSTLLRYTYDARGRPVALTDPRGHSWQFAYDGVGNLSALTDRKGNTLRFEHDAVGRLVRARDSGGRLILQVEYSEGGPPRRIVDAEGHWMAFTFHPSGYLTAISTDGKTAQAELDAEGRVLRLVDENGRIRTCEYDALGNLLRETYPLNQTYAYAYDPVGRLQEQTLPDGTRVSFAYDDSNRLTRLRYTQGHQEKSVTLTYSPDGRSVTLADGRGTVTYTLIPENVIERRDARGQTVRYEFSPSGAIRRVVYPDGRAVEYAHDDSGNLTLIRDFAGRETRLEYDENDLPLRVVHPNGWTTHYEYDSMGRVIAIRHHNAAGETMLEQRLVRDGTGRIRETEVYGPLAARVSQGPDMLARRKFTFNDLDQIVASDEGPFQYDLRGNLRAYPDGGLSVSLQYDEMDRLVEARIGGDRLVYDYDAEGNRIQVNHNGETRQYVLDTVLGLPRPLMEQDEQGNPVRYYVWGDGLQYGVDAQGHLEVYLFNHRGDTLAVVDDRGEVVAAYAYTPYGQVLGRYGERDVPFRFLGRHGILSDHDRLCYIRARYYAPTLGRFLQPDRLHIHIPLPGFLNRYAYALDDPWNLVDVDGRLPTVIIGAAIGGVIGAGAEILKQTVFEKKPLNQIDWKSVAAATVGGAVGGALTGTGVGALPILGGAISGGTAAAVEQALDNVLHGKTWHQGVTKAVGEGILIGAVADVALIGIGVAAAGIRAYFSHNGGVGKRCARPFARNSSGR